MIVDLQYRLHNVKYFSKKDDFCIYQLALKKVTEYHYCLTDFLAPFESKKQNFFYFVCPNWYSQKRNFIVFLAPLTATPMSQLKPHLIKIVLLGPFAKYKWNIQEFSSNFSFRGSSCCACNWTHYVLDVGPTLVPPSSMLKQR